MAVEGVDDASLVASVAIHARCGMRHPSYRALCSPQCSEGRGVDKPGNPSFCGVLPSQCSQLDIMNID